MNTPYPNSKEPHKLLRLIGALILASLAMLLLNALIDTDEAPESSPTGGYQHMNLQISPAPVQLIET